MERQDGMSDIRGMLCENIYRQLIRVLEYEKDPLFKADETRFYDMLYRIEIDGNEFPVVGISRMENACEDEIARKHLLYWNRNDIPVSVLVLDGEIRVYNNFCPDNTKALLYSSRGSDGEREFIYNLKASEITTKLVWERLSELSDTGDRVDRQLLSDLKNTVLQAVGSGMLPESAYNFMSLCIFVKYMEDRGLVTSSLFRKWDAADFTDFLGKADKENLSRFFQILKERFNGDLFVVSEKDMPSGDQMDVFSRFFNGEEIYSDGNSQLRLFPYDFSIIPIELISNIYETFFSMDGSETKSGSLSSRTGAFYTPYYLAEYMTMKSFAPFIRQEMIPSVLDPACGSGVFLVNSFRHQIEIMKKNNRKPDAADLCRLLENNIHGIDINLNALRISCFSLYVALLDELSPKDIMENNFKLPSLLGKNLVHGSYFADDTCMDHKPDIIIGNPPWKSLPGSDHMAYCRERGIPVTDAQIAQAFLCRAGEFSSEKTQVMFLVTNSVFTNKNSGKFLRYFLENNCVSEVLNLESLKTQLFAHAKYPCSILAYTCEKKTNYDIKYQSFQENGIFRLLRKFVCDKNDEICISRNRIMNKEYIWTVLTYGDEFDVECMENLLRFPALSTCIRGKAEFLQGYITSRDGRTNPQFAEYKGGSLKNAFMPFGVDYGSIPLMSPDILYDRPRKLELYTCPSKVLIKRTYNEKCWGAAFVKEPLVFSNDFSAFNDYSGKHTGLLRYIEGMLNSDVFLYYIFYMSKVKAAKKPEVTKKDVENFPVPPYDQEDPVIRDIIQLVIHLENLQEQEWKRDKENPWKTDGADRQRILDEMNRLIFQLYDFDDFHVSVIREGIDRFAKKSERDTYADESDYRKFGDYICSYFNYYMESEFRTTWRMKKKVGNFYTAMTFSFGNGGEYIPPDIAGLAGADQINERLLVQQRVLLFSDDGFQIVQTKEKAKWTIGRAKKLAAKLTNEIMCNAGGNGHE